MCKKSFWLSLPPWNPQGRRLCPAPAYGGLRPPKHLCTRRPVSSEAAGRRDGVRVKRKRTSRQPGHPPRRRSPFPSVSNSSSSSVSCGFPRLFRLLLQPRGSSPGSASPNRLRGSSIGFKSVKIMFGLSLRSGAACAAFVQTVRLLSVRSAPARSAPCRVQVQFGRPVFRRPFFRFTTRRPPPVPFVCSSGSWSVSRFVLCSVQFNSFVLFSLSSSFLFVLFSSVRSCSFRFVFSLVSLFRFLSSFHALCPLTGEFIILFPRILYTSGLFFQMYFLLENMSFLRIVQIIDIKAKKFDAFRYLFRPSGKPAKR